MRKTSAPGIVSGLFSAARPAGQRLAFVTTATPTLDIDLAGIVGDLHAGLTRASGAREPWLRRGTILRNDRQLSALCPAELAEIANRLGVAELKPEWIGANLLVSGLAAFSRIAPGSRLAIGGNWGGKGSFDGGAVLRVEGYNTPCRRAGRGIATALDRPDLEFAFVRAAASLRGLVLSVDVAGRVMPGDAVVVIPPLLPKAED